MINLVWDDNGELRVLHIAPNLPNSNGVLTNKDMSNALSWCNKLNKDSDIKFKVFTTKCID